MYILAEWLSWQCSVVVCVTIVTEQDRDSFVGKTVDVLPAEYLAFFFFWDSTFILAFHLYI